MNEKKLPFDAERQFFRPICNESEIDRILQPQNSKDELLRIRAELAVDNMRLFRFFLNLRKIRSKSYSFETALPQKHYDEALRRFPDRIQRESAHIARGDIFSHNTNGSIAASKFGPIITVSYSFRYFLKFMHLAILDFEQDVPQHVRANALKIAIRVMLQKESMDFLQDPRGIIPNKIAAHIHEPIHWQLMFIVAHEYAHFHLGHLPSMTADDDIMIGNMIADRNQQPLPRIYSPSEEKELAADRWAFDNLSVGPSKRNEYQRAIVTWFIALEIFEQVEDQIFPKIGWKPRSHPEPLERLEALCDGSKSLATHWTIIKPNALALISKMKDFLSNDIATNFDSYEFYGSLYLDKPETDWRGKELIDRVDFY